jgi:hypothetical protein
MIISIYPGLLYVHAGSGVGEAEAVSSISSDAELLFGGWNRDSVSLK